MKLGAGYVRGQPISRIYNKGELIYSKSQPLNPLEVISTRNCFPASNTQLGTFTNFAVHEPFYIGQDADTIVLSFNNYWVGATNDGGIGNDYTILDCCIYKDGETTVYPISIAGNFTNMTIVNDGFKIMADPVVRSVLKGEKWWIKMPCSIPVSNQRFPVVSTDVFNGLPTGKQLLRYNPADTTMSATYVAGVFTSTGTAPSTGFNAAWFGGYTVLGNPKVGGRLKTRAFVGDSIAGGVGDSYSATTVYGFGYLSRASNASPDLNPCLNLGVPSMRTDRLNSTTRWRRYLNYTRCVAIMSNTNDTSQGATFAELTSRMTTLVNSLRAEGVEKIIVCKLIALTTGTFTTAGGQTPNAQWVYPGKAYDYNDWLDTQVGTLIDAVVNMNSLRDVSAVNLWKGQTPTLTNDGVHPSTTGHATAAVETKSVMDAAFV